MVYGEAKEFNDETGLTQRFPTLPPIVGLEGFLSHTFICWSTVVYRCVMGILLGDFDQDLHTAFDLDYWLRAFSFFPHRIGYLPHVQCRVRLKYKGFENKQRAQKVLEETQIIFRIFGCGDTNRIYDNYLMHQYGLVRLPDGTSLSDYQRELYARAKPFINPAAFSKLQTTLSSAQQHLLPRGEGSSWQAPVLNFKESTPLVLFHERPFSVNVIGHAFDIFGWEKTYVWQ